MRKLGIFSLFLSLSLSLSFWALENHARLEPWHCWSQRIWNRFASQGFLSVTVHIPFVRSIDKYVGVLQCQSFRWAYNNQLPFSQISTLFKISKLSMGFPMNPLRTTMDIYWQWRQHQSQNRDVSSHLDGQWLQSRRTDRRSLACCIFLYQPMFNL